MMARRIVLGLLIAAGICVFAADPSASQDYPNHVIKMIVPFPPGGPIDTMARIVAHELSARLGQEVVVDNRPGAGSTLGSKAAAGADPDGYTLLFGSSGSLAVAPALYAKLNIDPLKLFAPVASVSLLPHVLVVGPSVPAKTVQELFDSVKSQPGKVSYASAGPGSPHAMAMELIKATIGLDMIHVPYRGGALSIQDVAAGQVPMCMTDYSSGSGMIATGKVRALAVANPKRMSQLPDVPTFDELGFKGIHAEAYAGVVVPAGTPADVVAKLQKAVSGAVADPSIQKRLIDIGQEPVGGTAQQFASVLEDDSVRWHKLIKDLNITLD